MPILRITSAVERYRYFAKPQFNIHTLAGHGEDGLPNVQFVSERILAALKPQANDTVVDIGCGNGYLLSQAALSGAKCVGVVPTNEEQRKLEAALPGISFRVGLAEKLPIDSGSASKIVCNSVLVLLENETNVNSALHEISRIGQVGAWIWLGEVPAADELSEFRVYQGTSVPGLLCHELRRRGIRPFLATMKSVVKSTLGEETLLLNSSPVFHASSEKFIAMATACGLQIKSWHKHRRLDRGHEKVSPYRYNYLFSKSS